MPNDESPPFVTTVRHFHTLGSTNAWALEHAATFDEAELPLLVLADAQHAGRGRSGRSWHADPGTLTFSVLDSVPRLGLDRGSVANLALMAGLSVAEAIDSLVPPFAARIKWPNDVLVAGGKVAGILVENGAHASQRVVVGIGVNVSTDLQRAPDEVRQRARSLADVAGRPLRKGDLMHLILERMAENASLMVDHFPILMRSIQHRCALAGGHVTLQQAGRHIAGHCLGMDDQGSLRIQTASGIEIVRSGEIVRQSTP